MRNPRFVYDFKVSSNKMVDEEHTPFPMYLYHAQSIHQLQGIPPLYGHICIGIAYDADECYLKTNDKNQAFQDTTRAVHLGAPGYYEKRSFT